MSKAMYEAAAANNTANSANAAGQQTAGNTDTPSPSNNGDDDAIDAEFEVKS
jgi:hypothetical protein